jgi:hypothetical protein
MNKSAHPTLLASLLLAVSDRKLFLATVMTALIPALSAQTTVGPVTAPPAINNAAQKSVVPGEITTITNEITFAYSFSPEGDLERNSKVGEIKISQYSINHLLIVPFSDGVKLLAGVFGSYTDLDITGAVPLPDRLQSVGLALGVSKDLTEWIGPRWIGTVMARPNFSSDSSSLSGSDFNLPVSLSFGYKQSPTLAWDVGVNVNPQGNNIILPLVGVRWEFAPDWIASLGFPQTGIAYKFSRSLTFKTGARFQGGTYHIGKAPAPGLDDTWLEYREIRVGAGFDYQILKNLTAGLDAGAVVNRKFDYFDRNYDVDGNSVSYFTISLRARF